MPLDCPFSTYVIRNVLVVFILRDADMGVTLCPFDCFRGNILKEAVAFQVGEGGSEGFHCFAVVFCPFFLCSDEFAALNDNFLALVLVEPLFVFPVGLGEEVHCEPDGSVVHFPERTRGDEPGEHDEAALNLFFPVAFGRIFFRSHCFSVKSRV